MLLLKDNMVWRMKNFDILAVHWKIQLLGRVTKNQQGGLLKKEGLGLLADLRGGGSAWQERGGGAFEGGWYPNAHYGIAVIIIFTNDVQLSGQRTLFQTSAKCHYNICLWRCHATLSQAICSTYGQFNVKAKKL